MEIGIGTIVIFLIAVVVAVVIIGGFYSGYSKGKGVLDSIFDGDIFVPIAVKLTNLPIKTQRIIADHIRGVVFLLADHVRPSNKEQGYILRRILRRVLLHIHSSGVRLDELIDTVVNLFGTAYPEFTTEHQTILQFAREEADKFSRTLEIGSKELDKLLQTSPNGITGQQAFNLFASYGLPIDFIKEKVSVNESEFETAFVQHQDISRAGVEEKFGGHGLSTGAVVSEADQQIITKLHTVTHLLHSALREILGREIHQGGSDINPERTRFDFAFPRRVEPDELKQIENWVNGKIQAGFVVKKETLPYETAIQAGALAFFKEKYPAEVDVYTIYNENTGEVISKELCGGPHIQSSSGLGTFRIIKEQSSSAGVRRIKAILE